MKYTLRGLDDLVQKNYDRMDSVLDKSKSDILCVGTGFEDVCNYQCIYCYAGDVEKKDSQQLMQLEHYIKLFEEAHNSGCKTIILTGALSQAEPMLSKKLVPSVKKLKELGIIPVIFSNLSIVGDDALCQRVHGMSGKELIQVLYDCDTSIIVSCDSIDEATYDLIVARENAFASFHLAEQRLRETGYFEPVEKSEDEIVSRICISTVVMKNNFDTLEEMQKFWHERNCQYICKFPSIMGNVLSNQDQFFTAEEASERKDVIEQYRDKSQTLSLISDGNKYCLMNQLGIALDSRGIPLTCLSGSIAFPEDKDFNVKNNSLEEIILRKKSKYSLKAGACPKKVKFYKEMALD